MSYSLLIPNEYFQNIAVRTIENEVDIACEIYIAKGRAIYYTDLMGAQDTGMATKSMLLSWLNDFVRNNEVKRKGIISLYKEAFPQHFENGKWQARNTVVFVDYAMMLLKDKQFIRDAGRVKQFKESIKKEEWFQQAVSIMCIKLLEDLFAHNALKSTAARALIDQVMVYRSMVEGMGKIIGRVGKTNELDDSFKEQVFSDLRAGARRSLLCAVDALENIEENKIFEKYQNDIQASLTQVLIGTSPGGNKRLQ